MTLRQKTLLISGSAICCLTIILLFATNTILLNGFTILEKQDIEKNLTRAQNVLAMEQSAIDKIVCDWAFWDDTYEFINDKNPEYIRKNINDVVFVTQKLNFLMYVDLQGEMVYGQGFDLDKKTIKPLPEGLLSQLGANQLLFGTNSSAHEVSGIARLPDGPAFVVSYPILDTDKEKPVRGTMIAGRYLTSEEIGDLADASQLSLSAYLIDGQDMPEDFLVAKEVLHPDRSSIVKILDEDNVAGYVMLYDIYQNPAMILRVDTPRHIYIQGKSTLRYLTVVLIVTGFLFGGMYFLFIEKTILSRLADLSRQVICIGKYGNPTARVEASGDDELAELSGTINKMLNSLALAQNELRTSESITRVLLEGIPDSLLRLDHSGVILDFKTGRSRLMAVSPKLLPGRKISECYPANVTEVFMGKIQEALRSHTQQVFEYEVPIDNHTFYQEVRIDVIGTNEVIAIIRDFEKEKNATTLP